MLGTALAPVLAYRGQYVLPIVVSFDRSKVDEKSLRFRVASRALADRVASVILRSLGFSLSTRNLSIVGEGSRGSDTPASLAPDRRSGNMTLLVRGFAPKRLRRHLVESPSSFWSSFGDLS